MKKNKYVLVIIIIVAIAIAGLVLYKTHKNSSDMGRLSTAETELQRNGQDRGGCQEYTLEKQSDFPAELKGKSIEQIKRLILQQPGLC